MRRVSTSAEILTKQKCATRECFLPRHGVNVGISFAPLRKIRRPGSILSKPIRVCCRCCHHRCRCRSRSLSLLVPDSPNQKPENHLFVNAERPGLSETSTAPSYVLCSWDSVCFGDTWTERRPIFRGSECEPKRRRRRVR